MSRRSKLSFGPRERNNYLPYLTGAIDIVISNRPEMSRFFHGYTFVHGRDSSPDGGKEKRMPAEKAGQGWIPLDARAVDPQRFGRKTINRLKNARGRGPLKPSFLEVAIASGTLGFGATVAMGLGQV
jgi:hypothetical protein